MSRVQVVRFEIGQRHFALDVMVVKEVVLPCESQVVPGQPDFVEGVVEMRGQYIPLIDLRKRFHIGEPGGDSRILVLACMHREIALLVDRVGEVQWLEESEMRPAPLETGGGDASAVERIADVDGTMVLVLRGEAILSEAEWTQVLPL